MENNGRRLTGEYQEVYDEFMATYGYENRGCTCFQSPPCGFCTHEGNPENLLETEEAWEPIDPNTGMLDRDVKGEREDLENFNRKIIKELFSDPHRQTPGERLLLALNITETSARKITPWSQL